MRSSKRTFVHQRHIKKGLEKYEGKLDEALHRVLQSSDWNYTPYLFKDGRILLVYENELYGLLYENKAALFQHMEEES